MGCDVELLDLDGCLNADDLAHAGPDPSGIEGIRHATSAGKQIWPSARRRCAAKRAVGTRE
jgi:hypothetical protein